MKSNGNQRMMIHVGPKELLLHSYKFMVPTPQLYHEKKYYKQKVSGNIHQLDIDVSRTIATLLQIARPTSTRRTLYQLNPY